MMRYHLTTALVVGFVFLIDEMKTDEKDDCFNYSLGEVLTVGDIAKECFQRNRCIADLPDPLSCLYAYVGIKPYDEANVETIYRELYEFANPEKLEDLNKSTKKCVDKIKDSKAFFNCTAYDMKEICPDDKYIKTKDC